MYIFLLRLFVNIGDEKYPALNRCKVGADVLCDQLAQKKGVRCEELNLLEH